VGKSAAAQYLAPDFRPIEVAALAVELGCGRRRGPHVVEVDVARLAGRLRQERPPTPRILVGHLAHLLPVDRAIVLRCHPRELARRLRRRRVSASWRRENVSAEAIDLVLAEARSMVSRVDEIDTTRRTPRGAAREIARRLGSARPVAPPAIDWLADPWVTEYLLAGDP
jgi:adenylate kinase